MNASLVSKFVLAAAVSLGIAGFAQARDLQPMDQQKIHTGMTQDEVRQALGDPAGSARYALSNTSTWTYKTTDHFAYPGDRIFDVDFGTDGKVISSGVRYTPKQD